MQAISREALPLPATPKGVTKWAFIYVKRAKAKTGTMGIADDVAVFGKDEKEHDANLHNLMKIAQQEGLVFNPDKCDTKKQKMRSFGLEFSSPGVNPDPEKIAAISQLQTPKDAVQL